MNLRLRDAIPARTLLALGCMLAPAAARADPSPSDTFEIAAATPLSQVEVNGSRTRAGIEQSPATRETVDAASLSETVNVINTEDALKYLPSLLVRKRHIGDTQAPLATRTNGVGSSARSLIYADGVLLSALIGNNNSTASPRWGMVSPDEISRIDVLYGPFSAAYPGNSIGAVVLISTRMPDKLEGSFSLAGQEQAFSRYGTRGRYPASQVSATFGDRFGRLSFWLSANHVESQSQPLSYVTAARPAAAGDTGAATTGGYDDLNRTGAAIRVLGASGFEDQTQDNLKLKLALDLTPVVRLAYTAGLFVNDTDASAQTYLRNAAGAEVYAGALTIAGYPYTVAASAFSNGVYRFDERHWMHSLSAGSNGGGRFDWQAVFSLYDYAKDDQRTPSTALPGALNGGAGSIQRMKGTGWLTGDIKAIWRLDGVDGAHLVSLGAHADRYTLASERYNTANWIAGGPEALATAARGKTRTQAVWAQDVWRLTPSLTLTLGLRYEDWRAYDGSNLSLAPALNVRQPQIASRKASPKASLQWRADAHWTATASIGEAYRFPTVSELYQAITTGATLTVPNPNLRPERAVSEELAVERADDRGRVRLSVFEETLTDALISQTAPLVSGSTTLFGYVQNIDRVRARGVELVAERRDAFIPGLTLGGSVTYVQPKILKDAAFAAAVGKRTPGIATWRATGVATWRASDRLTLTAAVRYSARSYANIDNSDTVTHTYQGFDPYLVVDVRAAYKLSDNWSAAVGVDNLNNRDYLLFHSFPQRAVTAELTYRF